MRTKVIRRMGLSLLIGTFAFGMTLFANPTQDSHIKIKSDQVVLVDAPVSDSNLIKPLEKDEIIRIGEEINNYTEVILDYGKVAYIESKHIKEDTSKGQAVVDFALKHVGNPYRYGGNSLTNGTDCSGFTSQVFKHAGVNIARTSGGQYSGSGKRVSKSDLQPGDLVFYGYNGRVNHVAIYMGNNKIVHAGTARTGIHVSPLQQRGMAPYIGAKRVL